MGNGFMKMDMSKVLSVDDYVSAYENGICKEELEYLSTSLIYNLSYGVFSNYSKLKYVSLPNLINVSNSLFANCENLVSVYLPNVSTIGSSAFESCTNLKTIYLNNCNRIEWRAFSDCNLLSEIYMPNIKYLGNYAFTNCYNISVIDAKYVNSIGSPAFVNCSKLRILSFSEIIVLPSGPIETGCYNIKSIIFENVDRIYNYINYNYVGNYKLILPKISDISIFSIVSSKTISITNLVCDNISSIKYSSYNKSKIHIDNLYIKNCSYIDSRAFAEMAIKNVYANNCISISEYAFNRCPFIETLHFPNCGYISNIFRSYNGGTTGGDWDLISMSNLRSINFSKIESIPIENGLFKVNTGVIYTDRMPDIGPLEYLNFHNLQKAGQGFLGVANTDYNINIDLTKCEDFNFLQNAIYNNAGAEDVIHNIKILSLPGIKNISIDNYLSENREYFIPDFIATTSSACYWDTSQYVNGGIYVDSLYMNNIENLHYDIRYKNYQTTKTFGSIYVGYSREYESFCDYIYNSPSFFDPFLVSPIHNIKALYLPKCSSFCINVNHTNLSLQEHYYYLDPTPSGTVIDYTYYTYNISIIPNETFINLNYLSIPKCKYVKAIFANSSMNLNFENVIDGDITIYRNISDAIHLNNSYSGFLTVIGMNNLSYFDAKKAKKIHLENLNNLLNINVKNVKTLEQFIAFNIRDGLSLNFDNLETVSLSISGTAMTNILKTNNYVGEAMVSSKNTTFTDFIAPKLNSFVFYGTDNQSSATHKYLRDLLLYNITNEIYIPNLKTYDFVYYSTTGVYSNQSFLFNSPYITSISAYEMGLRAKYITLGCDNITVANWMNAIDVKLYGKSIIIGNTPARDQARGVAFSYTIQNIDIPHTTRIAPFGLGFTDASINCPEIITGYNYMALSWYENTTISYLSFPEVSLIGQHAFHKLMNLRVLNIEQCIHIDRYGLYECPNLSYLYLPNISYIESYALPSNINILRLGSVFKTPSYANLHAFDITTGINSEITKILQVPESMYSQYSNNSEWQSIFNNSSYNWVLTAY